MSSLRIELAVPLVAVVLVTSCASFPSGADRQVAQESQLACEEGAQVLVVRNDSGADVEIVQSRGPGERRIVAVLPHGRHEVRIPNETGSGYFARRVGDRTVLAATSQQRVRDREVLLNRECSEG